MRRRYRRRELERAWGSRSRADRLGNLIATLPGTGDAPSVMLFAHMDQLGFVVRRIEADGFLRVERLGGVPERALAAQEVLLCWRRTATCRASSATRATMPRRRTRSTACCPMREI